MHSQVYWIEAAGKTDIGIMPRPRGGEWLRDEIASLASAGVEILVSLLTPEEIEELNLGEEPKHCYECGISFVSLPISDRGVPASTGQTVRIIEEIAGELRTGKKVAVHCRMGIGRSAMVAACLLASDELSVDAAFEAIERARGFAVPDTEEQRAWVDKFGELRDRCVGRDEDG